MVSYDDHDNPNKRAAYEASHYHNFPHPPFPQIHIISPRRLCVGVGLKAVKCLMLFVTV
jgi:hypothetical protein